MFLQYYLKKQESYQNTYSSKEKKPYDLYDIDVLHKKKKKIIRLFSIQYKNSQILIVLLKCYFLTNSQNKIRYQSNFIA